MKTIADNTYKKAEIEDKPSANDPAKDKFCYANDPLGLERSLVVEIHHDLVASLTGYYTVVAGMIEKSEPAKEVFLSEHTGIRQTYSEREIISEALSKEYRELAAFADEWEAARRT